MQSRIPPMLGSSRRGASSQKPLSAEEQKLGEQAAQILQQSRLIWLLTRKLSESLPGSVVLDQRDLSPAWNLEYQDVEGQKDMIRIVADQYPDPTEEQIAKMREILRGTSKPLYIAQKEVGLDHHPSHWLQLLLMQGKDGIFASEKSWEPVPVTEPTAEPAKPDAV